MHFKGFLIGYETVLVWYWFLCMTYIRKWDHQRGDCFYAYSQKLSLGWLSSKIRMEPFTACRPRRAYAYIFTAKLVGNNLFNKWDVSQLKGNRIFPSTEMCFCLIFRLWYQGRINQRQKRKGIKERKHTQANHAQSLNRWTELLDWKGVETNPGLTLFLNCHRNFSNFSFFSKVS